MSIKPFKIELPTWVQNSPHYEKWKPWAIPGAIALFAALLLFTGVKSYKERLGYNMEAQTVLVSAHPLMDGHILKASDLMEKAVPAKLLPVGTLSTTDREKITGLTVTRPIPQGAVVFWSDLDVNYMPPVPARKVSKGYRALSINVDDVTSVAHALRPGDHVDLIATLQIPGEDGPTTMTLLQNVTVLDVGIADQYREGENYSTVTLMVLPKEVSLITFADKHGKLNVVLRNPDETLTPKDLPMVAMSQLLESAFRNSIQDERNNSVEIIRGGKRSLQRPLP